MPTMHIDTIEYLAYAELVKQNEELKRKLEVAKMALELSASELNNYMLGFATQTERCESLETKLSIAVKALSTIADNSANDLSFYAAKALKEIGK